MAAITGTRETIKMLTQIDVAREYTLDSNGVVRNPGKFEAEHWTTVAMYDLVMNGMADDTWQWADDECEDVFILDDELRRALNCDASEYAFTVYNDSQGFVYGHTIDRETYDQQNAEYENQEQQNADMN